MYTLEDACWVVGGGAGVIVTEGVILAPPLVDVWK